MDILKQLNEHGKELYPEDLELFQVELATGEGYDDTYKKECLSLISKLRKWNSEAGAPENNGSESGGKKPAKQKSGTGLEVGIETLVPQGVEMPAAALTTGQLLSHEIEELRERKTYKSDFKKYVAQNAKIDAAFVDAHYSVFMPWELDAIISVKQMTEEFLEKYFGALDHDKIARYQRFSEGFFMKHFVQLDPEIVLMRGKNEWRKKENRSKQLDVFLRLKGIQF